MNNFQKQCKIRTEKYVNSTQNCDIDLATCINGVGSKAALAVDYLKNQTIEGEYNPHFNIGVDLVHTCLNDIVAQKTVPLFFSNYFSTSKIHPGVFENLVSGMSWACKQVDCPMINGKIDLSPGFHPNGMYDLVGSMAGQKNEDTEVSIEPNDVIIGVPSSGLHMNGYSLIKSDIHNLNDTFEELEDTLGKSLLVPTKSYHEMTPGLCDSLEVRGMVPVTEGIESSLSKITSNNVEIDWDSWEIPKIFKLIQKLGNIENSTMISTFNLGIGMAFVVHRDYSEPIIKWLKDYYNEDAVEIGKIS